MSFLKQHSSFTATSLQRVSKKHYSEIIDKEVVEEIQLIDTFLQSCAKDGKFLFDYGCIRARLNKKEIVKHVSDYYTALGFKVVPWTTNDNDLRITWCSPRPTDYDAACTIDCAIDEVV